jgi:ribonuclease HI
MSKYYAVKYGRIPGIYGTWNECQIQVNKYPGANFKSFKTEKEANEFMSNMIHNPVVLDTKPLGIVLKDSAFCDGGHNKMTGDSAFGSVVFNNGNDLIEFHRNILSDMELRSVKLPVGERTVIVAKFNDVSQQQNNGAELLAMVACLRIALLGDHIKIIYSDSDLLLRYWSLRLSNDKRMSMDPLKVRYIDELINIRKEFEYRGGILEKVSGDRNLADLGYHR